MELTLETAAYLALGAAAGGFVNGLAGFGTSLFALGWWLQALPPAQAVALALAMSVASGLQGVWVVRREIAPRRLALFLLPALAGIPLGLTLLAWVDARQLTLLVAAFLLAYGGFFAARRDLPKMTRPTPLLDAGVGFLGGVLGAMAGLSGALPTMWLALRGWSKTVTRAVLQPYNVLVLGLSAGLLAVDGVFAAIPLAVFAVVLPTTLLSAQIGLRVFARLSDAAFQRLLITMMGVFGAALMLRVLLL